MQRQRRLLNAARRHWRHIGATVIVVAVAFAVDLTRNGFDAAFDARSDPPVTPTSAPARDVLNATDIAFLQLMIPMNESALPLFALLAHEPTLGDLAGRFTADHLTEVRDMRALLAAAGVAEEKIHAGHRMPGMILDEDLDPLRRAPAGEMGPRAVALIRAHLAQGELVAASEVRAGASPGVTSLAARLQRLRAEQHGLVDRLQPSAAPTG